MFILFVRRRKISSKLVHKLQNSLEVKVYFVLLYPKYILKQRKPGINIITEHTEVVNMLPKMTLSHT